MRGHVRILVAALLVVAAAVAWAAQSQSVQVRKGQLRETPSFLGKITAHVAYGDQLDVLESERGWSRVRDAAGHEGWIHGSALSEKKIVLRAGDADVATGASTDEIALAGKGFNEEVENAYRQANPALDFTWIDRMEGWNVDADEAVDFLASGGVTPPEGGAE